jgi:hypothetical protein
MKKYKGMNFTEWCMLDADDERKINYTLKGFWEGKKHEVHFTSEDDVDGMMLFRVQNSLIEDIKLINNEWHAILVY